MICAEVGIRISLRLVVGEEVERERHIRRVARGIADQNVGVHVDVPRSAQRERCSGSLRRLCIWNQDVRQDVDVAVHAGDFSRIQKRGIGRGRESDAGADT